MKHSLGTRFFPLLLAIISYTVIAQAQTNFAWGRQFGTAEEEEALSTVIDGSGNVYITGSTEGNLSGRKIGKSDGFISKLDSTGIVLWTRQFGTPENDRISWAALDKKGNIYLTGTTGGSAGTHHVGAYDIWILKFDSAGTMLWQQQYGTDSIDAGNGICVNDQGDIFISGITKGKLGNELFGKSDCILLKLDSAGNMISAFQFGTRENDQCNGISIDASSRMVYVCGFTAGDLSGKNKGNLDAFLSKFDSYGRHLRTVQFGTKENDKAMRVDIDREENIYIAGSTAGDFGGRQQGEGDCFLLQMNRDGNIGWTRQFGTKKWDGALGLDIESTPSENIVISGCQNWPECQSFVRMYSKNGECMWIRNSVAAGKGGGTCGKDVCLDAGGNVYHTGFTGGNLFNSDQGAHDVFIMKYVQDTDSRKSQ